MPESKNFFTQLYERIRRPRKISTPKELLDAISESSDDESSKNNILKHVDLNEVVRNIKDFDELKKLLSVYKEPEIQNKLFENSTIKIENITQFSSVINKLSKNSYKNCEDFIKLFIYDNAQDINKMKVDFLFDRIEKPESKSEFRDYLTESFKVDRHAPRV